MSREIKFRAWDKANKVMVEEQEFSSCHLFMTFGGLVYNNGFLQDYIMMQFIGLKDKNGKKIYEGDIVEYDFEPCGKQTGVFHFLNGRFCLKGTNNWRPLECEVIGNIYEDASLLDNK